MLVQERHRTVGPARLFTASTCLTLAAIGVAAGFFVAMGLTVEQRAVVTTVEAVVQGPAVTTPYGEALPVAYSFQEQAQRSFTYNVDVEGLERGDTVMLSLDENGQVRSPEGWGLAFLWGTGVFVVFTAVTCGIVVLAMRLTR